MQRVILQQTTGYVSRGTRRDKIWVAVRISDEEIYPNDWTNRPSFTYAIIHGNRTETWTTQVKILDVYEFIDLVEKQKSRGFRQTDISKLTKQNVRLDKKIEQYAMWAKLGF